MDRVHHEIAGLLAAVRQADSRPALSDQLWLDLTRGGRPGSAGLVSRDDRGQPIAYAQTSAGNDSTVVQLVVDPAHRDELNAVGTTLLRAAADVIADDGGTRVTWWVSEPTDDHLRIANELGWAQHRRLLQMRRALPTGADVRIETRSFRPGADDEPWLSVNNRAFSEHGEQGGWDLATLRQRMAEPWFDPDGFLVHERDGRMAGFCWTKLHHDLDPVEGEIYVIAVDPDFHGSGLGAQLTLAGLESIERRGVGIGMLYVDADNTPAVTLYDRLGFTVHRTDVAFTGTPHEGSTA